eukprot:g26130.t1
MNSRFISRTHNAVQNVTQAQRNASHVLKTRCNIIIKPADKGEAIVMQNRTDYCKEVYRQLNRQEHYRQLPAILTKEHTCKLNRLVKTFDPVLQSTLCTLIPRTSHLGGFYCLPKIHKANTPGRPIVSGNGTLCENLSDYVEGIIVQGTPNFCRDITDFLQKLSTHGPVKPGTFLITMDILALYTSIAYDDGIATIASELNTNNYPFPDTILQLIHFILGRNVFTFNNQIFIQTHGTAIGARFAPQYDKIFMHRFEQDFFAAQNLRPMLYTRYIDDIFFLWTHGKESLKQLHSHINKFHGTTRLTMDYSSESASFLDTHISIRDGHLSTSLYHKPMDNFMMLHFSIFHPQRIKTAIPYEQYFPGAEKLRHVLCSLQHIIDDDEHLAMIFPMPPLLAFKQLSNFEQTIVHSKYPSLQDNINRNTIQPCHGNLCKTCQIFNMDT